MFTITSVYSDELNMNEIKEFCSLLDEVYEKSVASIEGFQKKYLNNPYGKSIIVRAYDENRCIGTQAFLRNDLNGSLAFQSGDSAVLNSYRGCGIFSAMVKKGIQQIPSEAFIYGFPNNNSLPAFRKMNWIIGNREKYKIFSKNDLVESNQIQIDYFKWMMMQPCSLCYKVYKKKALILRKKKNNIYVVIGWVDDLKTLEQLDVKKIRTAFLLNYSCEGKWGNGMIPIWYGKMLEDRIPIYKIDTNLLC